MHNKAIPDIISKSWYYSAFWQYSWTFSKWWCSWIVQSNFILNRFRPFKLIQRIFLHCPSILLGIVHPKMKIQSSFTHLHVVPNLYEFLSNAEHKKIFWRMLVLKKTVNGPHWLQLSIYIPSIEVNRDQQLFDSSKYLLLCSTWNSYRFGTTWGWVTDDWIFISGWTTSLIFYLQLNHSKYTVSVPEKKELPLHHNCFEEKMSTAWFFCQPLRCKTWN